VLLFAGIKRLKSNRDRFRAAFTYYQAIQTFLLVRSFLSPAVINLDLYASAVVMIQHELTPLHSPLVNALIISKNTLIWSIILSKESLKIDVNFCMVIFWSFFHMFNYLYVKKQTLFSLFQSLQSVQREEQKLQTLLQAIPDGVAVLTENREIVAHNQGLLAQLHLSDSTQTNTEILRALGDIQYLSEFMERKATGSVIEDMVAFIECKEGREDSTGVVAFSDGIFELRSRYCCWDKTPACAIIVRDISHWVNLERKAQRESAGKTALLRSVSHELRTPTNAILNLTRELRETEQLSEDGQTSLQIISSSTTFLLSIINDLLDYSRIITGNFRLSQQICNLREIVTDCVMLVKHQCHNKGLALSLFYDSLLPAKVLIDPTRIKQVLLNLLSNALKFTLRGALEVSALLNASGQLTIRVKDTGIGISVSDQSKIFRLFGKLEGHEQINPQGCGLGLSISNYIVASLGGGHITVKSKVGKGSEFAFDVDIGLLSSEQVPDIGDPITDMIDEDPPMVQSPLSSHLLKLAVPAQVLIADDSDFNRIVARRIIEVQGFTCEEAVTGLQALNQVRERLETGINYKLILMDIEMPEMDGNTATREIRELIGGGEQPMIVGCSAYSSTEDRETSLAAGMDHYLEKPLQRELLYELLARLLV
jgi:signal transduction histidine kinase/ActR/RegA family two-component response regulator